MKIFDYIDEQQYREMVDKGYISVTKHPDFDLWVINYTKQCQAEHIWNDTTEKCRGIIVDVFGNVVARPFRKFYNYEELLEDGRVDEIPNMDFDAYEKLDGSLGILYWYEGVPYIATKGSFASEQAKHATELLRKYDTSLLDKNKTYLFEVIYPEDLHCITYSGVDDIFLLAVIDTNTGVEDDIDDWSHIFKTTNRVPCSDWKTIRDVIAGDNREGFVIKFKNGFRMKLKYASYWQLHFLKAGFSEKSIFGYLASGDYTSINEAMSIFDEEHKIYYQRIIDGFYNEYRHIVDVCAAEYRDDFETQKDAAAYFKTCTYPGILFLMRAGRDTTESIWSNVSQKYFNCPWQLKAYLMNKERKWYNKSVEDVEE